MRGLFRKAWRVGDDGAWPDRDDPLRRWGFPSLYALWSCFLRACDASRCIVGEKEDFSSSDSEVAGSETTQAQRSGSFIAPCHRQRWCCWQPLHEALCTRNSRWRAPCRRVGIPIYRIRSSQLHCSQIRNIGVRRSRTHCSQMRRSRIRSSRARASWQRPRGRRAFRRSARRSPHHGRLRRCPRWQLQCLRRAGRRRPRAGLDHTDPCKPKRPSPIPGQMRRRKLTFSLPVPFPSPGCPTPDQRNSSQKSSCLGALTSLKFAFFQNQKRH